MTFILKKGLPNEVSDVKQDTHKKGDLRDIAVVHRREDLHLGPKVNSPLSVEQLG